MNDATPVRRRRKATAEDTPQPLGYRSSRRSGKAAKKGRRDERLARLRAAAASASRKTGRGVTSAGMVLGGLLLVALLGLAAVNAVNYLARWSAKRSAAEVAKLAAVSRVKENLLVISVQNGQATGFLAMRVDRDTQRAFGIAIPDGAFVEVPGQGFERIGDSFKAGADISLAAVANYLSVPFDYYVVVDDAVYKSMLKQQSVSGLMAGVTGTNLDKDQRKELAWALASIPGKNVGLAPLPVRSINIGTVTYYEPQRDQIADLLYSWWGVRLGSGKQPLRLIIYNGAGVPAIAGEAAQRLIKAGYRVVDTGNADRFDYAMTEIVLFRGDVQEAGRVRDILGVGEIVKKPPVQNITDVIIIVGKDYKPL